MTREVDNKVIDDETAFYITDDDEIWDSLPPLQKAISRLFIAGESIESLAEKYNASVSELQQVVEKYNLAQCERCANFLPKESLVTYDGNVVGDGRWLCEDCRLESAMEETATAFVDYKEMVVRTIKENFWPSHGLCFEYLEEDESGNDFGEAGDTENPFLTVELITGMTSDNDPDHVGPKEVYGGIDIGYYIMSNPASREEEGEAGEKVLEVYRWLSKIKADGVQVGDLKYAGKTSLMGGTNFMFTIPLKMECRDYNDKNEGQTLISQERRSQ